MTQENQVTVAVTLNGEKRAFAAGTTLLGAVRALGLEPERVAVELDGRIVKRDFWGGTPVSEGAEIEIVMFVGGG